MVDQTWDIGHLIAEARRDSPGALDRLLESYRNYLRLLARTGLSFDQARQTGVVFHMLSALTTFGRVGMTAIGHTPGAAQELYDTAERALLEEAREAATPPSLPS